MRGEGVCSVVWTQDGRWVFCGGGDGVVKVFARTAGEGIGGGAIGGSGAATMDKSEEGEEGWRF